MRRFVQNFQIHQADQSGISYRAEPVGVLDRFSTDNQC